MCGRITLKAPAGEIAAQFALVEPPLLEPRYNVAPTQPVLAVRRDAEADARGPSALDEFKALIGLR